MQIAAETEVLSNKEHHFRKLYPKTIHQHMTLKVYGDLVRAMRMRQSQEDIQKALHSFYTSSAPFHHNLIVCYQQVRLSHNRDMLDFRT